MGQVAWGCVGGAEARANSDQSNRVQLVGRVAWVCVGRIRVQGGRCFQVGEGLGLGRV